jgi:hypothetical protein
MKGVYDQELDVLEEVEYGEGISAAKIEAG